MSIQDRNAGNAGDLLKHTLLLEILSHLPFDLRVPWSYTETHAGAGMFETPLAADIFHLAEQVAAEPQRDRERSTTFCHVGRAYADELINWRRDWLASDSPDRRLNDREAAGAAQYPGTVEQSENSDNAGDTGYVGNSGNAGNSGAAPYPGSPLLAWRSGKIKGQFQLAEADTNTRRRLNRSLDGRVEIKSGSFELNLDQLFAPGSLIALVDPYYYDSEAGDGSGGRLSRNHLTGICERLQNKDAVLLLFTSSLPGHLRSEGSRGEIEKREGTWRRQREDLQGLAPPVLRSYLARGTAHAVLVAGWGEGESIVAGLPGAADWSDSWLATKPLQLDVNEV